MLIIVVTVLAHLSIPRGKAPECVYLILAVHARGNYLTVVQYCASKKNILCEMLCSVWQISGVYIYYLYICKQPLKMGSEKVKRLFLSLLKVFVVETQFTQLQGLEELSRVYK